LQIHGRGPSRNFKKINPAKSKEPLYTFPVRAYSAEFSQIFLALADFIKFGGVFSGRFFVDFRRQAKIQRVRISGSC